MPHTRIQEQLTALMEAHSLSADDTGVEGLLIRLIDTATDPQEAQRYLNGLSQHLRGDVSVSLVQGDVLFRTPYSG
jgi:hypothetical protein